MSLAFLSPSADAPARSPMERQALSAGAELEQRDGWNVAVRFDGEEAERERCLVSVGFADLSYLGKIELQAVVFFLGRCLVVKTDLSYPNHAFLINKQRKNLHDLFCQLFIICFARIEPDGAIMLNTKL